MGIHVSSLSHYFYLFHLTVLHNNVDTVSPISTTHDLAIPGTVTITLAVWKLFAVVCVAAKTLLGPLKILGKMGSFSTVNHEHLYFMQWFYVVLSCDTLT